MVSSSIEYVRQSTCKMESEDAKNGRRFSRLLNEKACLVVVWTTGFVLETRPHCFNYDRFFSTGPPFEEKYHRGRLPGKKCIQSEVIPDRNASSFICSQCFNFCLNRVFNPFCLCLSLTNDGQIVSKTNITCLQVANGTFLGRNAVENDTIISLPTGNDVRFFLLPRKRPRSR